MTCRAIYTVRRLTPAEQRLVRETLLEGKQRIFLQQFGDGFPTFPHYGLDMGDGTVVHFSGKMEYIHANAWIQRTSCAAFCRGGVICPAYDVRFAFPREEVARRALSQVGCNFGGYNFLCNNCEHFVNWCACGRRISRQVMMREQIEEDLQD